MKTRHSSGFTSVPVAIMSTVTTIRGYIELRNCCKQVISLAIVGSIGDLGGELIALAEHLTDDLHDVISVRIVFGEDQRLGDGASSWEHLSEQLVLERLDHRSDLVFRHDGPVKLTGGVLNGFIRSIPADTSGLAVTEPHELSGLNGGPVLW